MLTVASFLLGIFTALAGLSRLWCVTNALSVDPAAIAATMGAGADRQRLEAVSEALRAEGADFEADLLGELLRPNERIRIASVNELLGDVAEALAWGKDLPKSAMRIGALGALCLIFAGATRGLDIASVLEPVAWGGAGILTASLAGKEADRFAASARCGVDSMLDRAGAAALPGPEHPSRASAGVDSEPVGV